MSDRSDMTIHPAAKAAIEIWDRVSAHLLAQGRQSKKGLRLCLYRGPDGTSCAVGCLIPDHAYDPQIEDGAVRHLDVGPAGWRYRQDDPDRVNDAARALAVALNLAGIPADPWTRRALIQLQHLHDNVAPAEWPERLRDGRTELAAAATAGREVTP